MSQPLTIEWGRARPAICCVAIHPGTVRTPLSLPFIGGRDAGIFSADEAALNLLAVLDGLSADDSGGFFAWDGTPIPW